MINILDPESATRKKGQAPVVEKSTRKPRQVKVYKNPHNGELIETKGGNHKTLKLWKAEYGADVVESWVS